MKIVEIPDGKGDVAWRVPVRGRRKTPSRDPFDILNLNSDIILRARSILKEALDAWDARKVDVMKNATKDTITVRTADGRCLGAVSRRTGRLLVIRGAEEARRIQRLALARHGLATEIRYGATVLSGFQRGGTRMPAEPPEVAVVSVYAPPTDDEIAEIEGIG